MSRIRRYLAAVSLIAADLMMAGCGDFGDAPSIFCWGGKCEASSPNEAGQAWVADWTILVFAANDDSSTALVDAFKQDLDKELHDVGGSSRVRLLVQRDYAAFQVDESGKPRPSERYGLYRQRQFDPRNGQEGVWLLGETDTTKGGTLQNFLTYGIRRFPAKRYWVIISGHGDSWNGLAFDACTELDDSGCRAPKNARMPLAEFAEAFRRSAAEAQRIKDQIWLANLDNKAEIVVDGRHFGMEDTFANINLGARKFGEDLTKKIDVVQFDACHMGNLETAFELRDSVDYMIGSQEVIPNTGYPYSVLGASQVLSGAGGSAAVKAAVVDYVESYVEGDSTRDAGYVGTTVSSVGLDLNKLGNEKIVGDPSKGGVLGAIKTFQQAALAAWPGGLSCSQLDRIATAARERAQLDATYVEPTADSSRCVGAAQVALDDGQARVSGDLTGARDEFGGMSCGGGAPLLGPQRYYRFAATAGRTYDVALTTDFEGGQGYMFTSTTCDPVVIQSECAGATTGPLRRRQRGTMQLTVPADGSVTVAVDSAAEAGRFRIVIRERQGRATAAYDAAVDVSSLFEVLAGPELYHKWVVAGNSECAFNPANDPLADLLPLNVRQAALGVIDAFGRPYLRDTAELQTSAQQSCGVKATSGGGYRQINDFRNPSTPLLIEAHYVKSSSDRRATGLSVLFGDVFPLLRVDPVTGKSGLETYESLTFNKPYGIGWSAVFQQCINELKACAEWTRNGSVGPNLCEHLPF